MVLSNPFFKLCRTVQFIAIISLIVQTSLIAQSVGDYRSNASGNWNSTSTWVTWNGAAWVAAGSAPTATSPVYIDSNHTVTLTQDEGCLDLHLNRGGGDRLVTGAFTLAVSGKLRGYSGTAPGASSISLPTAGWIQTGGGGKIQLVGGSRSITNVGEWTAMTPGWRLEVALDAGATGVLNTSVKAAEISIVSGTIAIRGTSQFRPDNNVAGGGLLTIGSGATLKLGSGSLQRTATQSATNHFGTLTVNGTLQYDSASVGVIGASTINFNGTVTYAATTNQTLVTRGANSAGADPSTYSHLRLAGSGTKTLGLNTTVNGSLTLAGTAGLGVGAFSLTYGISSTLEYAGTAIQTTTNAEFPGTGVVDLLINNSNGVRLHASRTVGGNVTIAAGGDLQNQTGSSVTMTLSGSSAAVNIGGTLTGTDVGAGNDISFVIAGGTTISGSGATARLSGLTVNSAATLTLARLLEIKYGSVTVEGTLQLNDTGSLSRSGGATIAYGSFATLQYNGNYVATSNEFPPTGVRNLRFLTGTVTHDSFTRTLLGNLTIESGALLDAQDDIVLGGNWVNNGGGFFPNNNAVTFNGAGSQSILRTGGETFDDLVVAKSGGALSLLSDITVVKTLTVTTGTLNTGIRKVFLASAGSLSEAGGGNIVIGKIEATRTISSTGSNETFGGIGLELLANNFPLPGSVTLNRVTGSAKTGTGNEGIKRYYDVSAATSTGLDLNLTFHYDDDASELNGKDENKLLLFRSSTGSEPWTTVGLTSRNPSANRVTLNNVSDLSTWTASDSLNLLYPAGSAVSDIVAVSGSEAMTISSLETDPAPLGSGDGVGVWQLRVRDGGALANDADLLPTELIALNLNAAPGNSATPWTDVIRAVDLFSGATHLASGSVSAGSISFSGFSISAADDDSTTLSLRLSLKNPMPEGTIWDGKHIAFTLAAAGATAGNAANKSQFESFATTASDSTMNEIEVVASKLAFTVQPSVQVNIFENFVAAATAQDANGNTDKDYVTNVVLSRETGTGNLTAASTLSHTPLLGTASWSDLQSDVAESGVSLRASSGSLSHAISDLFAVVIPTSTSSDVIATSSSESATVASIANDPSPLTVTDGVQLWQVTVRDGGNAPDLDSLPTILTSINLVQAASGNTVLLWNDAVLSADLFNGSVHLDTGVTSASEIQFNGLSVSVPDNGSVTLSLRISLKPSLPTAIDGQAFRLRVRLSGVISAGTPTSSQFSSFVDAVSAGGQNVVDVAATKLSFVQQPRNPGVVGQNLAPVSIRATDANNNLDLNYSGVVTLNSLPFSLSSADPGNLSRPAVAGVVSWSDLVPALAGTGTTSASATGLLSATSNSYTVLEDMTTTVADGNWSNASVWSQGSVPDTFQHAVINHTVSLTSNAIARQVTVNNGATLDAMTFTLAVSDTFALKNNSTFRQGGLDEFVPGQVKRFDSTSNFIVYGDQAGLVVNGAGTTFGNLEIGWTGTASPGDPIIIQGTLTINNPSAVLSASSITPKTHIVKNVHLIAGTWIACRGTGDGTWAISGDVTIDGGTMRGAVSTGNGAFNISGNLINNGGVIQNGAGSGESRLNFMGSGSATFQPRSGDSLEIVSIASGKTLTMAANDVTLTSLMTVNGILDPNTQSIFGTGSVRVNSGGILRVKGANFASNYTHNGATILNSGSGVSFEGSAAQSTGSALPSAVHHMTIANAAGVVLSANTSVGGTLTLTNGILSTGSQTLTIAPAGSVSRTSGHVHGNLRKSVAMGSGVSRIFEIGDAGSYAPVALTFGNVSTAGTVTASTVPTEHPAVGSSGLDTAKDLNRYYSLSNDGIVFDSYSSTFEFNSSDLDAGANTNSFNVWKYSGSVWSLESTGVRTDTTTQTTGVTSFSDFAIGETESHLVAVSTLGNGTVTKSPDQPGYLYGSNVQLTVTPATGYSFAGWSGDASGLSNPIMVNVDGNKDITATFTINSYALSVSATNGTVAKNPDQLNYTYGSTVELTATPIAGYHFTGWSGDATGAANPLTVNVDSTMNITASFAINTYALGLTASNGSVVKSPDQPTYNHGTSVELTAIASPGYHFTGWSGGATGNQNPLMIIMDSVTSITANFSINEYALNLSATNGSVVKDPDQATYPHGSTVQLTANPAFGYHFVGWSGDTSASANPLSVLMTGNKSFTATFATNMYTLSVAATNGSVGKNPDQPTYAHGSTVELTATPDSGYAFIGWSGDTTGNANPLTIVLAQHTSVIANFAPIMYTLDITASNGSVLKSPDRPLYGVNEVVQLTAVPDAGYQFLYWDGEASGNALTIVVTMDTNKSISAIFGTATYALTAGWNMVSVPNSEPNFSKSTLFPQATSNAFAYYGGYKSRDTLANGVGYWIKYGSASTQAFGGVPRLIDTIEVNEKWNLIGGISTPVKVSTIGSIPGSLTLSGFYGYIGKAYTLVDTLKPGCGYWVKASEAGRIILSVSGSALPIASRIRVVADGEMPPDVPGTSATVAAVPTSFALQQNYPNPFNPSSEIRFELPEVSEVRLIVYDILGNEVAILVEGPMEAGAHRIQWLGTSSSGSSLSSGVYYLRLIAGKSAGGEAFSSMRKMMLLR